MFTQDEKQALYQWNNFPYGLPTFSICCVTSVFLPPAQGREIDEDDKRIQLTLH